VVLVLAEDCPTGPSLGSLLAEKLGCRIHDAATLDSAMAIYVAVRIHLVVIVASDRERGLEQLRALLGSDRSRRAPILVVVRCPAEGVHVEFLQEGADDAVPFLCSETELLVRVERRLAQERERHGQRMARKYSLAGDLTGAGLVDLVNLFEQSMLTGSLELLTHRGAAQLLVREGQVKHASFANIRGRAAFFELLREREGQFEFVPGDWVTEDPSGALEGPNAALLIEGSQALDEDPEGAPAVVRRSEGEPRPVAPPLKPDSGLAEEWLRVMGDPIARGEIRLLARDQVRDWTAGHPRGQRLRLALVTDVACGLQVVSHLAAPLAQAEIAATLRRPPSALGFTWTAPEGQTLEILLLDQERLRLIVDSVHGSPAVLILAPSYGDFLTFNVTSRTILKRLLQDAPPLAILGVGNRALEGQVRSFLKLAKVGAPTRFLQGSLWKLEITPRALIEEAIRQWARLPALPESRAA
jgi:hypothetical protein